MAKPSSPKKALGPPLLPPSPAKRSRPRRNVLATERAQLITGDECTLPLALSMEIADDEPETSDAAKRRNAKLAKDRTALARAIKEYQAKAAATVASAPPSTSALPPPAKPSAVPRKDTKGTSKPPGPIPSSSAVSTPSTSTPVPVTSESNKISRFRPDVAIAMLKKTVQRFSSTVPLGTEKGTHSFLHLNFGWDPCLRRVKDESVDSAKSVGDVVFGSYESAFDGAR